MSLVLEKRSDLPPLWRWWGARVGMTALASLSDGRPPASFSLDVDQPLDVAPAFGSGRFGAPALRAHRDGRSFSHRFRHVRTEADGARILMLLTDPVARISLEQEVALDAKSDVLTLSTLVRNDGDTPLSIEWLAAATLPLPADCETLRAFTGRHTAEFAPVLVAMPSDSWVRENRRGLTGHAGPPGVFISGPGGTRHAGRTYAAQLAWSGNHRIEVACDDDGLWTLQMGEAFAPGEIVLSPGASYRTPAMLATFSADGLNGASQNFHAAIRRRAPWPREGMRPRPVHLNSWEGLYFAQDESSLKELATRAAVLGAERFVVDDGWFRGRDNDEAALGDWVADPRKYPRGLGPLAGHVTSLGMEFGLWVEPEMVSPDSDLFRAHPEWILQIDGQPLLTARHQLVLDLGRSDVRDHLFDRLDELLSGLPIAYLKWDHNRDLVAAGGADGRARYHDQVVGAYALFDRLLAAYPGLEIEACAGGGGRIDAGIAERCHRFWTSDCIDATSRVEMQRGFLAFMPPEMMGSHVGASPAHSTGRSQGMAFRSAVALPGHFGIELDPATLDEANEALLADGVARYKALRDRLHHGRVWLGEGPDGLVWQAHGEAGRGLLIVTRTAPGHLRRPPSIVLPHCAGAGPLRVRLLHLASEAGHPAPDAPLFARMREAGEVFDGDWLAQAGLPTPAMKAESVAVYEMEAA
ncbi:alpha-galactosidase [Sphingomonas oryzagri]|uniref:alpha-galactosidase n=1 Tax=Sphingomonas oryzagri TaxID=3042314 RepID=A0ABT6N229_9SPHN|nr:alpha-galactosidase [Sphingomonas oryzagri]MDH7639340.1 alpha-galactosidase [Sphingomonas oryzagri]